MTYTIKDLWRKATVSGDCVEWMGARSPEGYGRMPDSSYTHRVMYVLEVGEIPKGFHIDHLCRNRACMNPNHLEAVTVQENILRGEGATAVHARKTHCIHGHEYTEENTYVRPDGNGKMCRQCQKDRDKRKRQ